MNIRKALDYMREYADMLSRARALALVEGIRPSSQLIIQLEELQGPSGGWPLPLESGRPESLLGTNEALFALLDLGVTKHEMNLSGLDFIISLQEQDGAWPVPDGEHPSSPGLLQHGEEAGQLYLTALLSSLLVAYGRARGTAADRALDLLLNRQLADGTFAGFPRYTTWYALPILAVRLGQRSGPAQNVLQITTQMFAEGGWYASHFATLLRNLLTAGYGMETPLVRNAWEQILMRQNEDGSWTAGEDEPRPIASTLEVMWCWRRINIPSPT